MTKIKQYSLSITVGNQKRKLIYRAPTKVKFILHELVSQIPLVWNYENQIHAYLKIKENKKLFENQSDIKTIREKTGFLRFI